jgi:2-haloacid dehalogenase
MGFFSAAPRPQPAPCYQAILFDVNETLLDMRPLKQALVKAFGNQHAFHQWFGLLLQYSLVDTVSGQYHDFGTIGDAALDMTANMLEEKRLKPARKQEIIRLLTELPPHKDAPKGLEMLLDAGYSLVAFTNSSQRMLDAQLRYADLIHYFEQGLSVETVRRFKPDGRTYQAAVQHLGLAPAEALLIAAHGWDVAGAQRAGLAAGFIARPGQTRYPLAPPPAYCGETLVEVARQLLGR